MNKYEIAEAIKQEISEILTNLCIDHKIIDEYSNSYMCVMAVEIKNKDGKSNKYRIRVDDWE